MVSLVDSQRLWFRAVHGTILRETPRKNSFCAEALAEGDFFEVPDALADLRFRANALVVGEPHARYYAGMPLWVDGASVGTLCVLDAAPRVLGASAEVRAALRDLARVASDMLVARARAALEGLH